MIILCDVDNVISDDNWRVPFIAWHRVGVHERFHDYHIASPLDAVVNLHLLTAGRPRVYLLTAMPEEYAPLRERWLAQNRIRYERILYRANSDHRHSVDLKRAMVRQLRDEGVPLWECVAAYDDRRPVVEMFRQEGLPGVHVQIHEQEHHYHGKA